MCSQKRNCSASVPISAFMCLWALTIFPRTAHFFSWSRISRPLRGIYKSLMNVIPFLWIFVSVLCFWSKDLKKITFGNCSTLWFTPLHHATVPKHKVVFAHLSLPRLICPQAWYSCTATRRNRWARAGGATHSSLFQLIRSSSTSSSTLRQKRKRKGASLN